MEHSDVLCRKTYWPGGAGHAPLFSIHIWLLLGANFGHWSHFGSLRGSCSTNSQYGVLANFYWTLLSSLPTYFASKALQRRYQGAILKHCPSTCKKRLMWVAVGAGVGVGVGVDFSKPESESESESLKFGRLRSPACKYEYQCFVTIIQVKVISDHPEMTL